MGGVSAPMLEVFQEVTGPPREICSDLDSWIEQGLELMALEANSNSMILGF